jgi:peptidoglycan hydrolase-like protein with peptidoglycan-binding domain
MDVHELRCGRMVAVVIAVLTVGFVVVTTANSANAATSCPSAERLSYTWARQSPTLASGDTGCAVAHWQARLNDWLNATEAVDMSAVQPRDRLNIDGAFGARTLAVTRLFQAMHHIAVDGVVGPITRWAYLTAPEFVVAGAGSSADSPVLGPGSNGIAVTAWQSALNRVFSRRDSETGRIAVDGVFGPETARVTMAFQASQGIVVDGLVGPVTRAAVAALAPDEWVGTERRAIAPAEGATPAAGICDRSNDEETTFTLEPDAPRPRCVAVSPTQQLRVQNGPLPTTVELAGLTVDLRPGEAATIGPAFGAYLAPGVHTVHVSIYGGSGPQLWLTVPDASSLPSAS